MVVKMSFLPFGCSREGHNRININHPIFSLELFHEITSRSSCMQRFHVHTPSGDQCQPPSAISVHSAPFSVLINQKKFKAVKVHKLLVIILNGRVSRRQPILHSYGLYLMEQKFLSINKYSFHLYQALVRSFIFWDVCQMFGPGFLKLSGLYQNGDQHIIVQRRQVFT